MPFFSIIIPTFNSAALMERCLLSVCRQNFSDFEVIVQDGGSTDATLSIVQQLQEKFPKVIVRVFSEPDKGIYDAMNKATGHALGQMVYYLGSDDYLFDNDVLASVHRVAGSLKYDVVYGDVFFEADNGVKGGPSSYGRLMYFNICHQGIFARKSAVLKYGGFNTTYFGLADWDLNVKFFSGELKTKYIKRTIAFFATGGFSFDCRNDPFVKVLDGLRARYEQRGYLRFKKFVKRILPV